jgi:hypothetical protein
MLKKIYNEISKEQLNMIAKMHFKTIKNSK